MADIASYMVTKKTRLKLRRATVIAPRVCSVLLRACKKRPTIQACYLLDVCNPEDLEDIAGYILLQLRDERALEKEAKVIFKALESVGPQPVQFFVASVTAISSIPDRALFYRRPPWIAGLMGETGLQPEWDIA